MNSEWPYDELPPDFLDWLKDMQGESTYAHAMTGVPQKPFQRGQIIYSDDLHNIQNVKFGRIDKDGKFVELPAPIPTRINHWDFGTGEEARLDSGLYRLQDIVNQSNVGFTASAPINAELMEVLTNEVRRIQEWREQSMEAIRQWVKDARGGDPAPLDTVMEFAAQYLTPEQLTWESLNMEFISTDHAWLEMEIAIQSGITIGKEDTAKACECILYLMMREGEDNGSLSPDV